MQRKGRRHLSAALHKAAAAIQDVAAAHEGEKGREESRDRRDTAEEDGGYLLDSNNPHSL